MNPLWVSLSAYGGVTTRAALHTFWAAGIRHVELAIGVNPTPDTVAVLQAYTTAGHAVSRPPCLSVGRIAIV
jgi:hypothetical protein